MAQNASGKSNLLNAFSFVTQFVVNSLDRRDEYNFRNRSFLLSNQTRGGKVNLRFHFIHKGTRYRFGISLDEERVYDEYLIAYPKGHPQVWYERTSSENTDKSNWKFGYYLKGEKQKLVSVTPPNVLFLSVANKFDHEQLSDVYEWFDYYVRVISPHIGVDQALLNFSASQCFEDKDLRKSIVKLLSVADLGITDINIKEKDFSDQEIKSVLGILPEDFREEFKKQFQFDIEFLHRTKGSESYPISWGLESAGTQRLFTLSGPWVHSLAEGFTLVVDELHASLHPNQVRSMVSMFHNPRVNSNNAQVIFNTHAVSLLDPELFRRDQIWLVEKDPGGASHLYPLTDYSPRKNEPLMKGYISGRYGAIPFIESFLED